MSLKIITVGTGELDDSSPTSVCTVVNSELGFELLSNPVSKGYNTWTMDIKFPDMTAAKTVAIQNSYSEYGTLCFVDLDNDFFAVVRNWAPSEIGNTSYQHSLECMVFKAEDGDITYVLQTDGAGYEHYMYFNITEMVTDDKTKQSLRLIPAYYYKKGFIKNLYFNYERAFPSGIKFVDQNGNRFVTLGGYLLYKVD